MEDVNLFTTQPIVDRAMQLAEAWLRADAGRRREGRPPSDYEPEAAEFSSYLHTAIKAYARQAVLLERERCAALISTGSYCRYVEHMQGACDCGEMAEAIRRGE